MLWLQDIAIEELVFVDEMGSQLGMTPLYARAPRGERAIGSNIRNRGSNLTTIGALSLSGMQASSAFEGGTDKDAFMTFVEKLLLPSLKPGQVVVMDNLGAHKAKGVKEAIGQAGCQLIYLPPYSPELNPIEECWSKVKAILRKIGARTKQALLDALGQAFSLISFSDIQGWFRHAGYRVCY